jgi:hypothetical protein
MIFKGIITKEFNSNLQIDPHIRENAIFFDIETTGLSRVHSSIFLCGVIYYENQNYVIEQFFDDSSESEKKLVEFISNHFKRKKYIITYNGNAFDIPFYENKCKKHDLHTNLDKKTLVDLYFQIKKTGFSNGLDNLKLKTIEKFMDINRKDELNGEDIIRLYNSYKITPKQEYLDLILTHNREDVLSLPFIFNYVNNHVPKSSIIMDKPSYNTLHLIKKTLQIKRNSIRFSLACLPVDDYDLIVNALLYKFLWSKKSAKIELELIVKEGFNNDEEYIKYISLKEYGLSRYEKYLILENNHSVNEKSLLILSKLLLEMHSK